MDYLIRLSQVHETFRRAEIESLAALSGIESRIVQYEDSSPFCIVRLATEAHARRLIARSILAHDIFELWGRGENYASLHTNVQAELVFYRPEYQTASFRFKVDDHHAKRSMSEQVEIIESFQYLDLQGPIKMNGADLEFHVFEEYDVHGSIPKALYFGRWVAKGCRESVAKYDLKKRRYIARTSMDAELSLVTANLTLAAPGKIIYDPFVGTGSFSVACSHFGAMALGSDIDGRSIRGTAKRNLFSNFVQYGLEKNFLDSFIADITHSPLREFRFLDGIICDPPYGVREGPKILGQRGNREVQVKIIDGVLAHLREGYVPPKKPYGFDDMIEDILDFAFLMLVDDGRLCMWMPTANEDEQILEIPSHPGLELVHSCIQEFNRWSRRLLTYRRLPQALVGDLTTRQRQERATGSADDVNPFRKRYFERFRTTFDGRNRHDASG